MQLRVVRVCSQQRAVQGLRLIVFLALEVKITEIVLQQQSSRDPASMRPAVRRLRRHSFR